MPWRSSFHCSKFRHVFGKPSTKERCYDGVPITRSVHDNHYCSANPCFIAVVTEGAGGGAFLVLPIQHTGRVDPRHPRVCGHGGRVLDVKWNPFDDHCVASCSDDATVKIWDIPVCGVQQNLTKARKTLIGHSRRVGLIEWHPTAENLLLSSAYDHKVLLWDVSQVGAVLRYPVRVVLMPVLQRYPSETLLLSVSFNSDGSRLAVTSKDRRVRILDPRAGKILQVSRSKSHRASKVLYLEGLKMVLSTGSSPWNRRQLVLWDPDNLSQPLHEEDLDGSAGVLFPFYDPDTRMLYLAGKGDGNIRYCELSGEEPYVSVLMEHRSPLPQKGLGVMPKRGLDVDSCEIFRFYRLIAVEGLIEPLSMIVPRKAAALQEDPPPRTAGNQAAMTAQEWLLGVDRGPVPTSLKPGSPAANPSPEKGLERAQRVPVLDVDFLEEQLSYQDAKYPRGAHGLSAWQPDETHNPLRMHCCEPAERPPPTGEAELLQAFYRQQEEIRGLREQLDHRDARITVLERDIRHHRTTF
ncbi:coronin-2A-like [Brachionichthys hirsutus]|uniref:coronin-2A-like n=1 Tax=Brachionichthys hirsutus TaxID=412623 RepID=UPI0036052E92